MTGAFWVATATPSRPVLFGLYVYSGLFAAWVAGRIWIRLGEVFTVTQAKRVYGLVGAGAVLGAMLGAAAARVTLAFLPVRHLLLLGAGALVLTGLGPAALLPRGDGSSEDPRHDDPAASSSLGAEVAGAVRHPYLSRVLMIVLLAAATGTAVDFVFKAQVASRLPPEELGPFFAAVSLATSTAALLTQVLGVGLVMRLLGVHRSLYVLPLLLGLTAGAVAAGVGLGAVVALRGVDGTLRHSLQRTSTELLFVPLPDSVRARAKPIVDLVGQRGGQALASMAILALAHLGGAAAVGGAVLVMALLWMIVARSVRARYLDVFRATLERGRADVAEAPDLDVSALEVLMTALSSRNDAAVLGALDLLAAQSRGRLVPTLILFHPSKPVVLRALDVFVREGRDDFLPVADRLLEHPDPEVRAAALRARTAVAPDPGLLRERLTDPRDELRATALVALVARGDLAGEGARRALEAATAAEDGVRRALARAIGEVAPHGAAGAVRLEAALVALAADRDGETRAAAADAMGRLRRAGTLPHLLRLLDDRWASAAAIDALAAMGEAAAAFMDEALDRPDVRPEIKWRLVRALSRSSAADAIPRLAANLVRTGDTALRVRILRALRAAQSGGQQPALDRQHLTALALEEVAALGRALAFRVSQAEHVARRPELATPGAELLRKLLRDKEREAKERLFLVLSLLYPRERVTRIHRSLESARAKTRASGRELLDNVLRPPLRAAVAAAVEDAPDRTRAARLGVLRADASYEGLLDAMRRHGGELAAVAAFHAAELAGGPLAALAGGAPSRGKLTEVPAPPPTLESVA